MANKSFKSTTVLREFGINEKYQLAMYLLDQFRGTTLSCRYILPQYLASSESRTQLERIVTVSFVDTILKHPMLQVGMINATSKTPSWIRLDSLDLSQHIKWHYLEDIDDFEQTVQHSFSTQLDERFPDLSLKQPGWKITIFRQGYSPVMEALLTWNHPYFDAMGAKVLHEDFFEMLIANSKAGTWERIGLDGSILKLPASPMLPLPLETLRSLPVDSKQLVRAFWEDVRPKFLNRDVSWAVWCPIHTSPYKTQYRVFFVDAAALHTILKVCREHNTTITGLINGLALITFSAHLDSTIAPAFQSSNIVDHRRNLPPAPPDAPWGHSGRTVSNYVTQVLHKFDKDLVARIRSKLPGDAREGRDLSPGLLSEVWIASAQNRMEIVRKLEAGLRNDLVGLFKYVADWQRTMRGMARRTRQFSWLVTNIGVVGGDFSKGQRPNTTHVASTVDVSSGISQSWSIDRAQFGLSTEIPAAAIEFALVSIAGGGMCVSANWPHCSVDSELGEHIMADMERWLTQLGSQ